jgi:hypothetical protein
MKKSYQSYRKSYRKVKKPRNKRKTKIKKRKPRNRKRAPKNPSLEDCSEATKNYSISPVNDIQKLRDK